MGTGFETSQLKRFQDSLISNPACSGVVVESTGCVTVCGPKVIPRFSRALASSQDSGANRAGGALGNSTSASRLKSRTQFSRSRSEAS